MNADVVQNLRYKLQKRVRRLNSVKPDFFHTSLQQFWMFVMSQPPILGILQELEAKQPSASANVTTIVASHEALHGKNEQEQAALSYQVLHHCATSEDEDCVWRIVRTYHQTAGPSNAVDYFRELFLEPFYEYVDEQLDDQRAVLGLLRRYKHKCEWFARENLSRLWQVDTQRGEKLLAMHLYEFLYDQGLNFAIEPYSISGRADLASAQHSDDPLVADAKIFDPDRSKGRSYIAKGFAQVYQYTLDFNEPVGYLVIFVTSEKAIRFSLSEKAGGVPFVRHNNKTIFLITVDIFSHTESASKRGALAPVEITQDDLIGAAREATTSPNEAGIS